MALTNLNYLNNITGGDKDTMRELILMFIEQVPEFTGNLRKHLAEQKYLDLGKEAHKAKSSVMIMGMEELGYDLKALQIATINGTGVESYPIQVEQFEKLTRIAVSELQEELLKLS